MSVNTAVVTAMEADAGISAIVGTDIYLQRLPQGFSGEAIVYQTTGDVPLQTSGGISDLKPVEITLNLYSPSSTTLETLKAAVVSFWNGTPMVIEFGFNQETRLYRHVIQIELLMRN